MLLELKNLAGSLSAASVTAGRTDDHLVSYPNKLLFEVAIDASGGVVAIRCVGRKEPSDIEKFQRLRKYECSKGGLRESTPGLNIDPLFRQKQGGDEKEFRKEVSAFQKALKAGKIHEITARQERLERLFDQCDPNWKGRDKTVDKCLKDAARILSEQLALVTGPNAKSIAPMRELLRRSQLLDAVRLYQQLTDQCRRAIVGGASGSDAEQIVQVLFSKPASVVLELSEWQGYDYPANHEIVWRTINHVLIEAAAPAAAPTGAAATAGPRILERQGVFGEAAPVNDVKMPGRKLPRLGLIKLRSLTKNAFCQTRYGLTEDDACPVGLDVREDLAASLEWIAQPERRNKTWSDISESCGFDKPALLFAYPSCLPADPPRLSAFFAGPGLNAFQAESRFEECARAVTDCLSGLVAADPRTTIRVFVLLKFDAARTKVVYSRQFEVQRLLTAAAEWQTGGRNLPPIFIRQFNEARSPCWRVPLVPFPANVAWCLNTCWLKGASKSSKVCGLGIGDGLTLLLDSGRTLQDVAARSLRQALANGTPLLLALAQAHQANRVFGVPLGLEVQRLLLPTIFGLLLWKMGSFWEAYVNDNPYLIGRLLSLADRLHRNYCEHERDGKLPPQLLGNALMPTALENPAAGLARLSERLPLYYRVAETVLRASVAEVEHSIDRSKLADRCTDVEKAQMLLGYLARPDLVNSVQTDVIPEQGEPS
jgi:hypothetical protein